MEQTKLWNKNFTILTIGQIISLFGNGILRFALPLHILLITGSAELMGRILALSLIPMALIAPFGGVLADRVNKKRIIVFLDFLTAGVTFFYLWTIGFLSIVPITIVALILLSPIKSMMSAATDASVPLIVPAGELARANSVTMTINSLSMLLGPMLGGVFLAGLGLEITLVICGVCFVLAAVMELFIRIPSVTQGTSGNMVADVMGDLRDGFRFAIRTKPIISKILLTIIAFNFLAPSIAIIGIPVIIVQNLGMDERMIGLSQGFMGAGGIVGGVLAGVLVQKLRIQQGHWFMCITALLIVPIGLVILFSVNVNAAFWIINASMFVALAVITMFSIQVMTFIQKISPAELLGKMMALIMLATLVSQPLGNWLVGILFDMFYPYVWKVIFPVAGLTALVAICSRMYFKNISVEQEA